ncbi:hypothetical protein NO559_07240 [Dasania sp. GY-MA-18]|uniref:Uncharacterized protein n=1 Tax=Dasania phycosphaerae TaxID=2950436 RepID=A0A9J6RJX2_9GAMM|nr:MULTISPECIES: hypothetical protein [Dasania]MCR8922561.1 hypothetical protein [Dasania sp. GY-MA-18]MCZ0864990.1 hypothetical protein [Dasania phycosphaerae]MCZ0868717.1 hypothetical protein [Dasania phycosphaerae]
MKTQKLLLTTAVVTALGGLYGCSEGDDSTVTIEGGSGGSTSSSISQNCPDWASARNMDSAGNDVCTLPSSIKQDRTLTSDIVWYMDGRVTVGNGNALMSPVEGTLEGDVPVLNVTLTIEPGTEIKGATGTFANLVITRGSKIEAVGTASSPIIFSSDDEGYDGAGEWGGLILQGYGLHNDADYSCDAGPCQNVDSEGESGFAGGSTADDNSGTLKYVVVTEGGYEFAPGNEINGISFVAVGSGTTVDYVQVNSNADDGVEFYGGAVNAKHLVLTGNLDDSVDWDEGYIGNLQYVLVKQTEAAGNTIEADTEGSTDFLSAPTIVNATFLGLIGDADAKDTLHVLKKSSAGFIHNSVLSGVDADGVYGTIANCVQLDGTGAQDNVDGTNAGGANPGLTINTIYNNVVGNCTNFEVDGSGAVQSTLGSGANTSVFTVADASIDTNYASQAAAASGLASIDWATFNANHPESTADASFLDDTDYAGAVDPAGSDDWFSTWIVSGSL